METIGRHTTPTLLVALGGNAITRPGDVPSVQAQFARTRETAKQLAPLLADRSRRVVLTHGNGPQVGNILLRSELVAQSGELPRLPVDAAVADTQGAMGYMIQQCLTNALHVAGVDRPVTTVVTQVVVDVDDPAFDAPTKPIGRFYPAEEAAHRQAAGWAMRDDPDGRGWRRVVPSPRPRRIIEIETIRRLLDSDVVVIACGGGGIPVVEAPDGTLAGVDAVIDKDLASALLARRLDAAAFAIVTDVDHVNLDHGTPEQRPIERIDAATLRRLAADGGFPPGSMGPKVDAVLRFVADRPEGRAVITSEALLVAALEDRAGTRVTTTS